MKLNIYPLTITADDKTFFDNNSANILPVIIQLLELESKVINIIDSTNSLYLVKITEFLSVVSE